METLTIDIINPKARKLLEGMNLITIRQNEAIERLERFIEKIRSVPEPVPALPSYEEITKEVEMVRQQRYEQKRQQGNY